MPGADPIAGVSQLSTANLLLPSPHAALANLYFARSKRCSAQLPVVPG